MAVDLSVLSFMCDEERNVFESPGSFKSRGEILALSHRHLSPSIFSAAVNFHSSQQFHHTAMRDSCQASRLILTDPNSVMMQELFWRSRPTSLCVSLRHIYGLCDRSSTGGIL